MAESRLEARNISVRFGRGARMLMAVDSVSLGVTTSQVVGVVGESGSGKTTLGRVLVGLQVPLAGEVFLDDDLLASPSRTFRHATRRHVQMVFQDPYSSLNPTQRAWQSVAEVFRVWHSHSPSMARDAAVDLLGDVGIGAAQVGRYPHELSGGQRQRVSVARALAVRPKFLIADEPTSSIDVSAQAQLLMLLKRIQSERGLGLVFITHNLRVVRYLADWICVMQAGRFVESNRAEAIFEDPSHPYTRELIAAVPGRW